MGRSWVSRDDAMSAWGRELLHGGSCAYTDAQIWLRDEAVATKCADVLIVSLYARRQSGIPLTFGQRHVDNETVKLLVERGWTEDTVKPAWASCPRVLSD